VLQHVAMRFLLFANNIHYSSAAVWLSILMIGLHPEIPNRKFCVSLCFI